MAAKIKNNRHSFLFPLNSFKLPRSRFAQSRETVCPRMPPPFLPVTTTVAEMIIADAAVSSPKPLPVLEDTTSISQSGSDIPMLSSGSNVDTGNQPFPDRQTLEQLKLDFSSDKIKMEQDFVAATTGLKRKCDQLLRQKELALESEERRIQAQELEAKNQHCDKEKKALKESIGIDYRKRLLAAYASYLAAEALADEDLARDALGFGRKAKVSIAKISGAHGIDPKTLQKYAIRG